MRGQAQARGKYLNQRCGYSKVANKTVEAGYRVGRRNRPPQPHALSDPLGSDGLPRGLGAPGPVHLLNRDQTQPRATENRYEILLLGKLGSMLAVGNFGSDGPSMAPEESARHWPSGC